MKKTQTISVCAITACALLFTGCAASNWVNDLQKALQALEVIIPILQAGGLSIAPQAEQYTQDAASALSAASAEAQSSDSSSVKATKIDAVLEKVALPEVRQQLCGSTANCSKWELLVAVDASIKVVLQDFGVIAPALIGSNAVRVQAEKFVDHRKLAKICKQADFDLLQVTHARFSLR